MSKPTSNSRLLPAKEASIFKRIVKCYEQKQYKNGLKFAKQILSNPKFSEHGETLAMKGLILNSMGKREEAHDCVKRGLRSDLNSSICWHVYGLIMRSERKYDGAIRCYRQALKLDADNMQILRDLSLLQMQMRDKEGYNETRHRLLQLRPSQKVSWIGFAMSYHLLGNYEMATNVLEEYRKTQEGHVKPYDYEHSELILYQISIMIEAGKFEEALSHADKYVGSVVDICALQELRADLFMRMGRFEDAEVVFRGLVDRNPENRAYYDGLEIALARGKGTNTLDQQERLEIYTTISSRHSWASMPRKIPLEFLSGTEFERYADSYLRRYLHKGVPPLFMQISSLYKDKEKANILGNLVTNYVSSLNACHLFSEKDKLIESDDCKVVHEEPLTTLIWANFFLAQHLSEVGRYEEAMKIIDQQINHTPTLIEFYALKGQVYRAAGDFMSASRWLDEAQSLDTADRYINTQCAQYMIEANRIADAEIMAAKFTRDAVPASQHLNEMQCMWYLSECAAAYRRMGKLGETLQKCEEVDRHFSWIIEDQFDFHTYCLRKMTLRAYVEMLRLEDRLRDHPAYLKAARHGIEIYLHLHRYPMPDEDAEEADIAKNLTPSESKKLRNKQRKARKRAEQEAAKAKADQERREAINRGRDKDKDNDGGDSGNADNRDEEKLDPQRLCRPSDPVGEASRLLTPLLCLSSGNLETHLLGFNVYEAKSKPLLMLRSLLAGKRILDTSTIIHPSLHRQLVLFRIWLQNHGETLVHSVRATVEALSSRLWKPDQSAWDLNEIFLEATSNHSMRHRMSYVLSVASIKVASHDSTETKKCLSVVDRCRQLLLVTDKTATELKGFDWQDCLHVLDTMNGATSRHNQELISSFLGEDFIENYRQHCQKAFPMAAVFNPHADQSQNGSTSECAQFKACNGIVTGGENFPDDMEP